MRYLVVLAWLGLLGQAPARAQVIISGQLVDEQRQPVPFASVALADGSRGTASNEVGEFTLSVRQVPQQLLVGCIGYERTVMDVQQAGPQPALTLRASAVQLPEVTVRANAEAEALVRRCYAQLLRHENDVQYGRAFYRQKTRQNGRYREFFDAFYDVRFTPRTMPGWVLGEARYALTPGGVAFTNFSALTRSLPVFVSPGAPAMRTALPLSPDGLKQFRFVLRQTLREHGRELAVIDFAPLPGIAQASRGTLYIDPHTAALFRTEQNLPAAQMLNLAQTAAVRSEQATLHLVSDFVARNDSLTRLVSTRATATIGLTVQGAFSDETTVSSHFFFYEYGPPTPGMKYTEVSRTAEDLAAIRKRRYHPGFWQTSAVLKDSPVEAEVIADFEGRKVFGQL